MFGRVYIRGFRCAFLGKNIRLLWDNICQAHFKLKVILERGQTIAILQGRNSYLKPLLLTRILQRLT